jgi:TolB-like protein
MSTGTRGWSAVIGCLVILLGAQRELAAQNRAVVIAILPFEDRGSYGQDKEIFRALRLGIPSTIAGELSGHPELRLADPQRVTRALKSQNQDGSGRLDAATAARIGKEAGARYAITGNFADFYGKFSLSARVVDVQTGQIVRVVTNDDPGLQDRASLYRIVQTVGHKVLAAAGAGGAAAAAETENRVIPTGALTDYSLGLLYESQGDKSRAARHYDQALAAFPAYPEARDGARRVRDP